MTDDLQHRAHALLKEALDLAPADRAAFVARIDTGNTALAEELRMLLAAHDHAGAFLEVPALAPTTAGAGDEEEEDEGARLLGRRIGAYTIRAIIASGGMGTVYEAEQDDPHRTVAIKVIRQGLASREARQRFRYEAEILARLRHPGIAQIYEAHTHDDGTGGVPYFVMEHIPGARPITEHAEAEGLDIRGRLRLFVKVCDAVQHGHLKGVIHRDLKPANVLVDTQGEVKVIDFGVARLTDAEARGTLQTRAGQLIGTVQYMSPEQCTLETADLDTRSDVYSLGVILYELLSGRTPYDAGSAALPEAIRLVREATPSRLSSFDRTLRGELDTIVAKALEKDRDDRYASPSDLGRDLERYLAGEAISARPRSLSYQLRVFARRNRTLVAAGIALFLVLVAGVIVSTTLYLRAEHEAKTSLDIIGFLNDDLLASVELLNRPEVSDLLENRVTIEMMLDAAPKDIDERFGDEPLVAASIHTTLGNAYHTLGSHDLADHHLGEALRLREQERGPHHRETLAAIHNLARVRVSEGRFDEARTALTDLLSTQRRRLGESDRDTLDTMSALAELYAEQGDQELAERQLANLLELRQRALGEDDRDTLDTMHRLAVLYEAWDRPDDAETLLGMVLRRRHRTLGQEHQLTLMTLRDLAWLLRRQERFDDAAALFERCLEVSRAVFGDDHSWTATAVFELAGIYYWLGRHEKMEPLFEQHIAAIRPRQTEAARALAFSLNNLAVAYKWQERFDEAEPLFREALELRRYALPPGHPDRYLSMINLATLLADLGEYEEGERLATAALDGVRGMDPPIPERVAAYMAVRGRCLTGLGRHVEAEVVLLESHECLVAIEGETNERTIAAVEALVELYDAWERPTDAEAWRGRLPDEVQ